MTQAKLPIQFNDGFSLNLNLAHEIGQSMMDDYAFAEPFQHAVIDDFLPNDLAQKLLAHFPQEQKEHDKVYERGYGGLHKRQIMPHDCDQFCRDAFAFFNSAAMLKFLEGITNIQGLLPDPYFSGGGFHEISTGGLLGIHADFRVNEGLQLIRRVNVLIYLNENWQDSYGGYLELWDKEMKSAVKRVLPIMNRCVIFNTDADSFHGHPDPLTAPDGVTRKSIALYYYTAQAIENNTQESRHTNYVARPNDSMLTKAQVKRMAKYRDKRAKRKFESEEQSSLKARIKSKLIDWLS
jgi:2OG-Fe(II) oxygenase superfamily